MTHWVAGKRRIVVTGATGHLGHNVVRQAVEQGHAVRALCHGDAGEHLPPAATAVRADVLDPPSLLRAFDGAEVVIHCAAVISIVGDPTGLVQRTNVDGARNAAAAAREVGVRRFVHISSVHAMRMGAGRTIDEDEPRVGPGEGSAYDRSKAQGEAAVRDELGRGLDGVILHPSSIIGAEDHRPSRMGRYLLDVFSGRVPVSSGGGFDWVDVRDVARTSLRAIDHGEQGRSYFITGAWLSIEALTALATTIAGRRAPFAVAPIPLLRVIAPMAELWATWTKTEPLLTREAIETLAEGPRFDRRRAEQDLGHRSRPVEETLVDLHRFFVDTGRLRPRVTG